MDVEEKREFNRRLRAVEQRTAHVAPRVRPGGTGGGGPAEGTYVPLTRADSPETLDGDVAEYTMGYVQSGTYHGGWFTRIDGAWRGLNVWRQPGA